MCASLTFSQRTSAQSDTPLVSDGGSDYPVLSRYATDLTQLAVAGKLQTNHERDAEVARVITSLSSAAKNPVLVSESDLDRDAIARGVASKIAFGDVPEGLRNKRVFRLNIDALAKGAKTSDEFVKRVQSVFAEAAQANGKVILFVDQLNQYAGSRATTSAAAAVKDAIESNHLRIIGGASPQAYASYIASDESVAKLFESISIDRAVDTASAATNKAGDKRRSPINEEFEGEKISSDMQELIKSAGRNGRVTAILQVNDVNNKEVRALLAQNGVLIGDRMAELGAMKVDVPVKAVDALMKSGSMNYISPDVKLESFGHITATTGVDLVRSQPSGTTLDGTGIGIAVIDSGIDTGHSSFFNSAGKTRVQFSKDFTTEQLLNADPYGHGTHVASAALGNYSATYQGIAPNANLINLKVLNSQGSGNTSDLLSALNWVLANKATYGIRVVNMSLGAPAISSYKNDPVCRAARALVDAGVVVVAAAGNNGKDANGNKIYGEIHSPGNEPSVITVGAANTFGTDGRSDDQVATYSSRGPTRSYWTDANGVNHYDNLLKPDLVAPGNKTIFAEAQQGNNSLNYLVTNYPTLDAGVSTTNNQRMMYLSGTSMATPIVSGAAALLLQANPKLTPNMVKMIMMYTAGPIAGFNELEQGTGELNVEGAVRLAKLVSPNLTSSTPRDSAMLTGSAP
ncbi:MAG TPA: S8 family serine peptidase, partial [Pyrinomonadaceae bacterium]|nr:S8 family serine peptidase [Pyrinomonadaceae bacterium]